ncbi:RNA-splicing factor [Steccherinum ochraceum]|uniref:Pre-mRNA-splicing factor CWC24 n=1 Tax=Steccherinum ochraceum TaxID=92696 RepID=A0A4R0RHB0_9APHY|nr:RNA-splicing factor [Steccherinum ochraceum]
MASVEVNVPFFKKKSRTRPTTSRKRSVSPPEPISSTPAASSSKSEVILPSKKAATNLLSAGSKRSASQRQSDLGEDEDSRRDGVDMKWSAEGSHLSAALEILEGDEAQEMLAKRQKRDDTEDADVPDDGLYRGQKAYKSHLQKNKEVPKAMRVGPQRASGSTIRTVTITDYQPDVCKDYKETGYCGFGDTCKFLHDRGTYLQGWQLDKLAENPSKQVEDVSDSDSDEDIPFACLICRKPYIDPVVTRCGHYFDSACAIKRFAKTPKCAACGAPTGGIFNRADKVIEKMRQKKEQAEADAEQDGDQSGGNAIQIEGLGQEGSEDDEEEDED